jgi:hypothetical protein
MFDELAVLFWFYDRFVETLPEIFPFDVEFAEIFPFKYSFLEIFLFDIVILSIFDRFDEI